MQRETMRYPELSIDKKTLLRCDPQATTFDIPSSVTKINKFAFAYCFNLKFLKIPEGVIEIDEYAFSESGIRYFEISRTVKKIGDYAFSHSENLDWIVVDSENPYFASPKDHLGGALYDKKFETLYAYPAPRNTYSHFPSTLKTIKNDAFSNNYNTTKLHLPKSLEKIEPYNISHLHKLEKISINSENLNFKVVDNVLFSYDLKTLHASPRHQEARHYQVPHGVTKIAIDAFCGNYKLESVKIPETVTQIVSYAFSECENLKEINLPNNLTMIEEEVFCSCSSLKSIEIPESVSLILERAFYDCLALESVKLPLSIKEIKKEAFSYQDEPYTIKDVYYPESEAYFKENVKVDASNDSLLQAKWHFKDSRSNI